MAVNPQVRGVLRNILKAQDAADEAKQQRLQAGQFTTSSTTVVQALVSAGFRPATKGMVEGRWTCAFQVPREGNEYLRFTLALMQAGVTDTPRQPSAPSTRP